MGQVYHPAIDDDALLTEAERAFDLSARQQASVWAGPRIQPDNTSRPAPRNGFLARMFGRDGSGANA